jgi:probable F420-dependent oxidoreductase
MLRSRLLSSLAHITPRRLAMKYGIVTFPTEYSIDPITLGKAVEERGFDSLFFPDHTHIPASRRTPWPGGAELPKEYSHTYDVFVALTAVAATTTKLLVGTGVCLIMERDPITTANEIASLDLISNGRFIFGVGGGWNEEEMENHGTDPKRRFKVMRERIKAMKEIWTKDEAEYHGEFVDFDPIWSWPKPAQKPHPPVYVGGDSEHTLKRVVDYGDAWMPIPMRGGFKMGERIPELQRLAAEAGRGPIPVTAYGVLPRPEVIQHYIDVGVERSIFWLPTAPESEALGHLDRYAELIRELATAGA